MAVTDRTALLAFRDEEDDGNNPTSLSRALTPSLDLERERSQGWRQQTSSVKGKTLSLLRSISRRYRIAILAVLGLMIVSAAFVTPFVLRTSFNSPEAVCSTLSDGYKCHTQYSRLWGQYSPFFSLSSESEISPDIPAGCTITFAQVLSRHGARYPTESKSKAYAELIERIQRKTITYSETYTFLRDFEYPLDQEDMTTFGEMQMIDSGIKFYRRYRELSQDRNPFIRASGSPRVVSSAELFTKGYHETKTADPYASGKDKPASVDLVISEKPDANNTLSHGICSGFEEDDMYLETEKEFVATFVPSILERVNSNLAGADLETQDIIYLMDLCPFHTVANSAGASSLSPFCDLFTQDEWTSYDYFRSLGKYYHYGGGNPLGATQGVGFVNELIARLTNSSVEDSTNVNSTLDDDASTFPLNRTLYADFSHDNTMLSIFTALGLFNSTPPLSPTTVQSPDETNGYSTSWSVPFGGHAYIEKMECDSAPVASEPYVRILLNDRVVPLHGCTVDALGRCLLDDFVSGLSYARNGGDWEDCFS